MVAQRIPSGVEGSSLSSPAAWVVMVALSALATSAVAQTTWVPTSGTNAWTDPANWSDGVPDAVGAVATFPNPAGASLIATTVTTGTLSATNGSGGVVVGDPATTDDIVRLQVESGTPRVNVSNGSANLFMYANVEGTQGFEKTGAGKFTFRFNPADQSYTGDILINGGILGINQEGSLGSSANGITIANGARLLAEPGGNSGTITLPATRAITLGGAQSQIGSGNAAVNLVVQGPIGQTGTGQGLVKTDAGVVTLEGTLSYTGETRIAGGTLALRGPALLPSSQNLRFNGASGTLDVGSTSQTVRTIVMDNTAGNKTITGAGGSLLVNGDANQGFSATVNGVVYDLAGLGSFTYDRANREFGASANGAGVTNTLNFSAGTNVVTATNIRLGGGGSNAAGQMTLIKLGETNTWNAGTDVFIGNFQGSGSASFQSGLTSPVLTVRGGVGGSSAVPIFRVANTSSGNQPTVGVLDLTGGSLDLIANEMSVGYHIAGANTASTGTLTMPAGTVVATTLNVAGKTASTGTPTIVGTLNQTGGSVTADSVYLGAHSGTTAATFTANYNLGGGTLAAGTIGGLGATFNANTVRNLNLDGGTVQNKAGGDLTIDGVDATPGGRLNVVLGTSGGTLAAEIGRIVTVGANARLTDSGSLTKTGGGTLLVNGDGSSATGSVSVSAGALGGSGSLGGAVSVGSGGTLGAGPLATLVTGSSVSLLDGSSRSFRFDSTLLGGDLVQLAGDLALTGVVDLAVSDVASSPVAVPIGTTLSVMNYGGTWNAGLLSVGGTPLAEGDIFSVGLNEWQISYASTTVGANVATPLGSGLFVNLTAVPEPSTAALAAAGAGLAAGLLRRRRCRG